MWTVCSTASELFICRGPFSGTRQNMGLVAALLLVQRAPGCWDVHRLSAGNIFEEYHCVGHPVLGAHDQAIKVARLVRVGIANLRIFVDGKGRDVGQRARPLDGAGNCSCLGELNHLVSALSGGADRHREPY